MNFGNCLIASAALCGTAAFLLMGRNGHKDLPKLRGWNYAHRGLHGEGRPENSMSAFRAALDRGYGIELDIHLLKDGNLAVIHDSLLKRTTGAEGKIEDLTTEELTQYRLEGTEETIPTFRQVLDLFAGKAPLTVELKPEGGNHAALCQAACDMLDTYEGLFCLESFDPRCIRWLKKNRPDLIRGQLTDYFVGKANNLNPALAFLLSHNMLNFLGRPDFVAYRYSCRGKTPTNWVCEKVLGMQAVTWTLKSQEEHDDALSDNLIPIFEDYLP